MFSIHDPSMDSLLCSVGLSATMDLHADSAEPIQAWRLMDSRFQDRKYSPSFNLFE